MEPSVEAQCKRYSSGMTIKRAFVILKEPGCSPEKKGAFLTDDHLEEFVRECIACRSKETQITVCSLTWNDDLWVDDGRGMIAMYDSWKSRRRRKSA